MILLIIAIAYVAGSINFSIILFKLMGKDDPRTGYSGNPGVTNVYRMAGPFWAASVLLLDVGRAVLICIIAVMALKPILVPWAGLSLIIGNRFPCFHGFNGGKGVANYLGFTAVITPLWAAISAALWVIIYLINRVPFIASFFMILALFTGTIITIGIDPGVIIGSSLTALFIIYNHKRNVIEYIQAGKKEED